MLILIFMLTYPPPSHTHYREKHALLSTETQYKSEKFLTLKLWKTIKSLYTTKIKKQNSSQVSDLRPEEFGREVSTHRIQITYRMFTSLGSNGKLLTLNFSVDTGATKSRPDN